MKHSMLAVRIAAVARGAVLLLAATLLAGCGSETQSQTGQPSGSYSSGSSVKHHLDAGMKARNSGNKQAAIASYTQAVTSDPACKKAYLARGQLYNELGQPKAAFNDFWKAIELDPSDSYAYDERAKIYRSFGKEAKAQKDEQTAIAIRSGDLNKLRERISKHRDKKR